MNFKTFFAKDEKREVERDVVNEKNPTGKMKNDTIFVMLKQNMQFISCMPIANSRLIFFSYSSSHSIGIAFVLIENKWFRNEISLAFRILVCNFALVAIILLENMRCIFNTQSNSNQNSIEMTICDLFVWLLLLDSLSFH